MAIRQRFASIFGRIEHEAGRLQFIPMILTAVLLYFGEYQLGFYMSLVTVVMWATYLISHTLEKWFYGRRPRF